MLNFKKIGTMTLVVMMASSIAISASAIEKNKDASKITSAEIHLSNRNDLTDELEIIDDLTDELEVIDDLDNGFNKGGQEYSVDGYIEYLKSLNVLTEKEIQEITKVEKECERLHDSIESLYHKKKLTKADEKQMKEVYEKIDKLNQSITQIVAKIAKAEGLDKIDYSNQKDDLIVVDDLAKEEDYITYLKSFNVLSKSEITALVEHEKKVNAVYASIDPLLKKEKLTKGEQAKIDAAFAKVDKLYEEISGIMDKIMGTTWDYEDYEYADDDLEIIDDMSDNVFKEDNVKEDNVSEEDNH